MNRLSSSFIAILIIMIIAIYGRSTKPAWGENDQYGILVYDDFGYYLYLPALFIYDDLQLKDTTWLNNIRRTYCNDRPLYQAHYLENGNKVIQYTYGNALLMSPGFFISHAFAKTSSEYNADGFSKPYQLGLAIYAMFFFFIGLVYLRKAFLYYFSESTTILLLLALGLGTNLLHLIISNTISPHIFLFTLYSILLYLIPKWYNSSKPKYIYCIASVLGLMILNRPTEILAIIVLLFWDIQSLSALRKRFKFYGTQYQHLFGSLLIVMLIITPQLIYWKTTTGSLFFDSYLVEGFKFLDPYTVEYLFSYKKGWFIYTPLMLLLIPSLILLIRIARRHLLAFSTYAIVYIYVLSSWDCWWYAESFGQRSIAQAYPFLLVPIGMFLQHFQEKKKIYLSLIGFTSLAIVLNLFQTWQEFHGIIHTSRMNKEYYWAVWGDSQQDKRKMEMLEIDRTRIELPDTIFTYKRILKYSSFDEHSNHSAQVRIGDTVLKSDPDLILSGQASFSPNYSFSFAEITQTDEFYYLFSFDCKQKKNSEWPYVKIITRAIDHRSEAIYGYGDGELNSLLDKGFMNDGWARCSLVYVPPNRRALNDTLFSHIWHVDGVELEIDNLLIEAWSKETDKVDKTTIFVNDFENISHGNWSTAYYLNSFNGSSYQTIDSINIYSSTLRTSINTAKKYRLIAKGSFLNMQSDVCQMVLSVEKENKAIFYDSKFVGRDTNWQYVEWDIELEATEQSLSELVFYTWNKSIEEVLVDHLYLEIIEL